MLEIMPVKPKKRRRKGEGSYEKVGEFWYLRYWTKVNVGGVVKPKRQSERGPAAGKEKDPPPDVVRWGKEFLATRVSNRLDIRPVVYMTLREYVETRFLPWAQEDRRDTSAQSYLSIWRTHIKPWAGQLRIDLIDSPVITELLRAIVQDRKRAGQILQRGTVGHIRAVLSNIFRMAQAHRCYPSTWPNPVRGAISPATPRPRKVKPFHNLEAVQQILGAFDGDAYVAIATVAYTGIRESEVGALEWPDLRMGLLDDGKTPSPMLFIERRLWRGRVAETKSMASNAPVPVIPELTRILEQHRARTGGHTTGPIFRNSRGGYLCLKNVVARVVQPRLNACLHCGLPPAECKLYGWHKTGSVHEWARNPRLPEWKGWHAFRRGLATNLFTMRVDTWIIKQILRHENLSQTLDYIQPTQNPSVEGLGVLQSRISEPTSDFGLQMAEGAKSGTVN